MRTSPSRRPFPSILLLLIALAQPLAAKDKRLDQLTPEFQKWLNQDVIWLITDNERNEFLDLQTDAERRAAIDTFWKIRDPQPLTVENEFRDEHERRLRYADHNLGTETSRLGRLTDRGRVWVLLGKPDSVERVVSANEVYPYELWFYGHKTAPGLPGQLRLLFYRPRGNGEFRLLNPSIERDRMFPPSTQVDLEDRQALFALVGPEVTQALESVSPGYGSGTSDDIIQELQSPKRIKQQMLERGLALNTSVKSRWVVNPIELPLATLVEPTHDGSSLLHLMAELPPKELTFQEVSKDRFIARVDVFGDIRDSRGVVVAQFGDAASLDLTRDALENRKSHTFAYRAVRQLVPGRYAVSIYLQDFVKGQLGKASATVEIGAPPARPSIAPLVVAFRVEKPSGKRDRPEPFRVGDLVVYTRSALTLGTDDTAYAVLAFHEPPSGPLADIEVELRIQRDDETVFTRAAPGPSPGQDPRPIVIAFPTKGLAPGSYQAVVAVHQGHGGALVASASAPFQVAAGNVQKGLFAYSEERDTLPEIEHYNRGIQLLSRGDLAEAERHFRISLSHRGTFHDAAVQLARTLLLLGQTDAAVPLLDKVLAASPAHYEALVTRGSLLLNAGNPHGAIDALKAALQAGPKTKEILNGLAEAAIAGNDLEQARRWFNESLALDPDQPPIQKRLETLGG